MLSLLHPAQRISLTSWTVHPSTVVGLVALGALYLWRARVAERAVGEGRAATTGPDGEARSGAQRAAFFGGLLVIFCSLNGPLHDLSDYYLFSGHMVQHLILTLVVPPLLIVGTPGWMLRPALK